MKFAPSHPFLPCTQKGIGAGLVLPVPKKELGWALDLRLPSLGEVCTLAPPCAQKVSGCRFVLCLSPLMMCIPSKTPCAQRGIVVGLGLGIYTLQCDQNTLQPASPNPMCHCYFSVILPIIASSRKCRLDL